MHVDSTGKRTIINMHGLDRMAELAPGLYQSGEPGTEWGPTGEEITDAGIDVLVNLYGQGLAPMRPGMVFMLWLLFDGPTLPDLDELAIAADYLVALIRRGKKVLISCQAGLNRSSLLAGVVLMKLENLTGKQAVERIRERRSSDALCNTTFWDYLAGLRLPT